MVIIFHCTLENLKKLGKSSFYLEQSTVGVFSFSPPYLQVVLYQLIHIRIYVKLFVFLNQKIELCVGSYFLYMILFKLTRPPATPHPPPVDQSKDLCEKLSSLEYNNEMLYLTVIVVKTDTVVT